MRIAARPCLHFAQKRAVDGTVTSSCPRSCDSILPVVGGVVAAERRGVCEASNGAAIGPGVAVSPENGGGTRM
jgi:hypothetical protein